MIYSGYQKLLEGPEVESLTLNQLDGTTYVHILGKVGNGTDGVCPVGVQTANHYTVGDCCANKWNFDNKSKIVLQEIDKKKIWPL